ncbi:MAG: hypothetical protein JW880_04415 [Candidatus Thermoplasmatota archaeon]|nr:hypothetical protein [Candidatus Thermoplasmatota archaeon]
MATSSKPAILVAVVTLADTSIGAFVAVAGQLIKDPVLTGLVKVFALFQEDVP